VFQKSIWRDALSLQYEPLPYSIEKFIVPLKVLKNLPSSYKSKLILSFAPTIDNDGKPQINGKDLWQIVDHREKPVCTFSPASPVGEQTGGEQLAGILSPWQPLVKL
jgi:hypothetical protein